MENNSPFEEISHCSICQTLLPLKVLEYDGTHLFIAAQEATIQKILGIGTSYWERISKSDF